MMLRGLEVANNKENESIILIVFQILILTVILFSLAFGFAYCWILRTARYTYSSLRYQTDFSKVETDIFGDDEEDMLLNQNGLENPSRYNSHPSSKNKSSYSENNISGREFQHQLKTSGVYVDIYTLKGPRPAKLSITNENIVWMSTKPLAPEQKLHKQYSLPFHEVLYVEWGKQTENFKRPMAMKAKDSRTLHVNCFVAMNRCLSLVSITKTLDLEVSTKVERDHLAVILTAMIDKNISTTENPSTSTSGRSRSSSTSSNSSTGSLPEITSKNSSQNTSNSAITAMATVDLL